LDLSSPIYTYYVSENTGTCHLTQLVGWDGGVANFLPRLTLNYDLLDLSPPPL
jgi:hypothetical protein